MGRVNMMGEFRHTMDAKRRLFVPAKFRESLGHDFVVSRSIRGNCLKVYPAEEWDMYLDKIREKLPGAKAEKTCRWVGAKATTCEPDSQGRIVLTEGLVDHAEIGKNAVIVGCGRYAEIWSEELYDADILASDEESRAEIESILDEVGL